MTTILIEMPDGISLLSEFLQRFRDFEQVHAEQQFKMFISSGNMTDEEVKSVLASVDPSLQYQESFTKQ